MAELTRLANGVTVAIDPMDGAQSASIGLYAAVGSRSEADGKEDSRIWSSIWCSRARAAAMRALSLKRSKMSGDP